MKRSAEFEAHSARWGVRSSPPIQTPRSARYSPAFTLVELLVTVVLMSLVFLLLHAGFARVSEVVIQGGRQSGMDRSLRAALEVMREDLEMAVVRESLPMELGRMEAGALIPLRLVRLRASASNDSDLEQVEYHAEIHPDVPSLYRLTRYSAPLVVSVGQLNVPPLDRSSSDAEILVDELVHLRFESEGGQDMDNGEADVDAFISPPASLDVWLALTRPRVPNVQTPSTVFDRRVQQFQGVSGRARIRPKVVLPEPEW